MICKLREYQQLIYKEKYKTYIEQEQYQELIKVEKYNKTHFKLKRTGNILYKPKSFKKADFVS